MQTQHSHDDGSAVNVCDAHEDEDHRGDRQREKPETQRVQAQVVDMATGDLLHPLSISNPETKEMQMLCGAEVK